MQGDCLIMVHDTLMSSYLFFQLNLGNFQILPPVENLQDVEIEQSLRSLDISGAVQPQTNNNDMLLESPGQDIVLFIYLFIKEIYYIYNIRFLYRFIQITCYRQLHKTTSQRFTFNSFCFELSFSYAFI